MSPSRGTVARTTFFSLILLTPCLVFGIGTAAIDGNEMLSKCKAYVRTIDDSQAASQSDVVEGSYCVGYVTGVIDDHFMWQVSERSPIDSSKHFCLPDGVRAGQAARVVLKWLQDHPARLHERAILLILNSLRDNFPCHN